MIVFHRQQEIGAVLLRDHPQGLLIGVQRVEHHELALQRPKLGEQAARGGNLVALGFDQFGAQAPSARQTHRADQLGLVLVRTIWGAAPLGLAVDRDQRIG